MELVENSREKLLIKRKNEAKKKKLKPSVYDLPLYSNIERPLNNKEKDFCLSSKQRILNKIINSDSRKMADIQSDVVSLIITSPPYNVGKKYSEYDDKNGLDDYLEYLDKVWIECYRVLRPGGRLCINIANIGRAPYLPLESYFICHLEKIGFSMRGQIIWNKEASVGNSTAWGSWMKPSNPTLRDVHEYILVFQKLTSQLKKAVDSEESDINKEEFIEFTKSIWSFPTESAKRIGHPAPFPIELPRRCIKLFSYPNDLILDPFSGSGTTCVSAKMEKRRYIGYEIDESYVEISNKRLINI
jgi:site-specific DNA-methyltransferase (adenine-specific)